MPDVMSATPSAFDNSHYEKACDQAIAMCDGNLRSTIKALIMGQRIPGSRTDGIAGGDLLRLRAAQVAADRERGLMEQSL